MREFQIKNEVQHETCYDYVDNNEVFEIITIIAYYDFGGILSYSVDTTRLYYN